MSFSIKSTGIRDLKNKFNDIFDDILEYPIFQNNKNIITKPKINLSENESFYFLEVELMGVEKKDIELDYKKTS